jgi:hydroxyacylglutathione hydrolase
MLAPHIVQIRILPLGMLNCHLLIGAHACVLVDTGLPGSEHKIGRALARHGRTFRDIALIIITHAHVDHAGSAARLRELSGAPILAHEGDLDYYLQKKAMHFCSTGWFGRLFLRTGLILQPYTPFLPDILLKDAEEHALTAYGLHGSVRHTPGHTAGSVSVRLEGGDAMVGDLLASGVLLGGIVRTGRAQRPPFEDNPDLVAHALQGMIDAGVQRFHIGHGERLPAHAVRRHVNTLRALAPALGHAPAGCCHAAERDTMP